MKKKIFCTGLLFSLCLLTACGSEGNGDDAIKKAESFIEQNQLYKAQDVLTKAKEDSSGKAKENINTMLEQITLYQEASDECSDKKYDKAKTDIKKIIDDKKGSAVLKDKAEKLRDKVEKEEKKQEDKKKESEESTKESVSQSHEEKSTWSAAKSRQLYSFMDSWATEMGQEYQEEDFDEPIATLGYHSIDDLVDGTVAPMVNGREITFSYSTSGDYEVVAAYDGSTNDGTDTTYVFAIGPGGPVALVAQGDNNGDVISFKPTANTSLQNGFVNIANG